MKELLKILDMPEEEQKTTALILCKEDPKNKGRFGLSLADLAFKLRDEVTAKGWDFQKMLNKVRMESNAGYNGDNGVFWICHIASPIHWIIAALIAKEKEDGKV